MLLLGSSPSKHIGIAPLGQSDDPAGSTRSLALPMTYTPFDLYHAILSLSHCIGSLALSLVCLRPPEPAPHGDPRPFHDRIAADCLQTLFYTSLLLPCMLLDVFVFPHHAHAS